MERRRSHIRVRAVDLTASVAVSRLARLVKALDDKPAGVAARSGGVRKTDASAASSSPRFRPHERGIDLIVIDIGEEIAPIHRDASSHSRNGCGLSSS